MILTKSCTEDIEFQAIFSFVLGLLLAPLSYGLEYTLAFVVLFELYVFAITTCYSPTVKIFDRLIINLFFFFGWVLARIAICRESGFEEFIKSFSQDGLIC